MEVKLRDGPPATEASELLVNARVGAASVREPLLLTDSEIRTLGQTLLKGHIWPSTFVSHRGESLRHHFSPILKVGSSSFPGKSGHRALAVWMIKGLIACEPLGTSPVR